MSEHSPSNQEVLELDAVTGSVRLPASWVEIVQTHREGDDLVVQLVDGRTLLVPGFFSIEQAVALVREPTGIILALDITPEGESQGVRSVSLSWLEEMFGIKPEELAATDPEAVEDIEEELAEESADSQADEPAAVTTIGDEAESDQTAEAAPESSLATAASGESETAAKPPREPKSAGSYVDEAMVVGAVLGVTALVGADDESEPPLAVPPALGPTLPNSEVVERGITKTEQERIFNVADWAIPDAARIPSEADVEWTPASGRGGTTLHAKFDLDGDGAVDAQTSIRFNADYVATGVDFDDNYDGSTDRSVSYTVNEDGHHTLARYDDDGDGSYDRAEAYGTDSEGRRVIRHDDDYHGAFLTDRIETITLDADGTTVVEVDENRDGSPERIERRFLDRSGKLSDVWVFDLSDGNPDDIDARKSYHYNEIGILERVDHDEHVDGIFERSEFYLRGDGAASRAETYFHDDQSRLVAIAYDDDNDGNPDWTAVISYEAAAGGSAISGRAVEPDPRQHATEHRAASLTIDEDYDRISDRAEHYRYAGNGYARGRLTEITYDSDHSNDGTFELRETFEYDPNNPLQSQPLRKYIDQFADGTVERAEQYRYSQVHDGKKTRIEYDDNYDGTTFQADRAEDLEYNERGLADRTRFDDDGDGDTDRIAAYRYGLDARIAEAMLDRNADGTWDSIERHSWNSDGRRAGRVYDSDADGTPDRIETYQYNTKGRVSAIHLDDDADGTVDSAAEITYNARGQEAARRHDYDADGTANRIDTYSYDGKGRLMSLAIQTDRNDNGNSNFERVDTLLYRDGLLTSRSTSYDSDEDGTSELDDTTLYDANGIRYERTTRYDADEDGTYNREEHNDWSNNDDSYPLAARRYPNANLVTTFLYDDFDDGTPNRKEVRQHDSQGVIDNSVQYFDNSNDGTWDRLIRTAYANGRQHILEIFEDFDGTMLVDRIAVYEHDDQGNLVRVKYDEDTDGQGIGDFERIETYTGRNDLGYLTHISHDDDADGSVDRTEVREYNAVNELERSTFWFNEDNDPANERKETLTYDLYRRVVRAEYDGAHGPEDTPAALGWVDPSGTSYGTADGTTDWIEETVWAGGAVASKTYQYFGSPDNGSANLEKIEVHHFEHGEVVRVDHYGQTVLDGTADSLGEIDPDGTVYGTADGTADGTPDWTEVFEYAPEAGIELRTTASYYVAGDASPKAQVVHEDHTDGSLIRTHRWDDAASTVDGTMDRAESHHFAADGHLLHILNDIDNDGTWESREQFTLNEHNIAVESLVTEFGSDGTAVVRTIESEFEVVRNTRLLTRDIVTDYSDGGTSADRIVDTTYSTSVNIMGQPIQILIDTNGDGLWETETISEYPSDRTTRTDYVGYHLTDDSIIDRGERQIYTLSRPVNAHLLTRVEFDMDYNGTKNDFTADAITEHTYGTDGRLTTSEFDINADATVDRTYSYSYNANGNRETIQIDDDGNGTTDRSERRVYSNRRGLLSRVEHDFDNDGTTDARVLSSYDDSDRVIRIRYDDDNSNDGTFERIEELTYTKKNLIESAAHDFDGDGTVDARELNIYDGAGRLSRVLYDDDNSRDGVYERVESMTYSNGRIESVLRDLDANGAIDEVESLSYDALGRVVESVISENDVDVRTDTFVFVGNSQRITERTIDWHTLDGDRDGTPGVIEKRNYDALGRIASVEYYDDGTAGTDDEDRTTSYSYVGDTSLIGTAEFDFDGDGTYSRTATYAYGTDDRLQSITVLYDHNDDGSADESEARFYMADRAVRIEYDGILDTIRSDLREPYDGTIDRIDVITYAAARTQSPSLPGEDIEASPNTEVPASEVLEGIAGITHSRIERIETNYVSGTDDDTIDKVETYHYDRAGNQTHIDIDLDADGNIDRRFHTSESNYGWHEVDSDTFITFDDDGNPIFPYADDGTFDGAYRDVTYDHLGRLSTREYSFPRNGGEFEVESSSLWLYADVLHESDGSDRIFYSNDLSAIAYDIDEDPNYDVLYLTDSLVFSLSETLIAPKVPYVEAISLELLHAEPSYSGDPAISVEFSATFVQYLAGGASGTVDNRFSEESPYTLKVITGENSLNDALSLSSESFVRDGSKDSDGFHAYKASDNDLLIVLVDPDITVTLT